MIKRDTAHITRQATSHDAGPPPQELPVHEQVYRQIRHAIISGRIIPGRGVTLRGLAQELGVSPMPVREAIKRLAAERALEIGANRRVYVPRMTQLKFSELIAARALLEPEAAARALPHMDTGRVDELARIDAAIDVSLVSGDVDNYVRNNYAFHFTLYRAGASDVLVPLIESLWLQFGPFMRTVYGRLGTSTLIDQHEAAIAALRARDEARLRAAIRADILDGMDMIGKSLLEMETPQTRRHAGRG